MESHPERFCRYCGSDDILDARGLCPPCSQDAQYVYLLGAVVALLAVSAALVYFF